MNKTSETCFPVYRPSIHILNISLIFIGNCGRYAHAKNNCEKCLFCIPEVDIKCFVLLPYGGLYHSIGFLSSYLVISS